MKLLLKERYYGLHESYEIYDGQGRPYYHVEPGSGLQLRQRFDVTELPFGNAVGSIGRRWVTLLPTVELSLGGKSAGYVTMYRRWEGGFAFRLHIRDWQLTGSPRSWYYKVTVEDGAAVFSVDNPPEHKGYHVLDIADAQDAPLALLTALALESVFFTGGLGG